MQPETATLSSSSTRLDNRKFLISALNGTAIYVLAYYVVWGLHQFAKMGVSQLLSLRGYWDPSRIIYSVSDREWWQNAIVAVYGIGPVVCLAVGLSAFWWYWKRERARRGLFKLLLLWIAFHACNAIFGALLADTLRQEGFWYVPDWTLRLGNAVNVILALVAGLLQLGLGYLGAVAFLQAHDSHTVMKYQNRRRMVTYTLLLPWLVGGIFIAAAKAPYFSVHEALHLLMMGLLTLPMALACLGEPFDSTVKKAQPTHVAWGLVGLAIILAVAWRIALSPPVSFG